ncbi:MAG: hypothetical protein IPO19_05915 [Rhodoferax sp.]|nr:hypothetical protein [Rhodoferax sp.]
MNDWELLILSKQSNTQNLSIRYVPSAVEWSGSSPDQGLLGGIWPTMGAEPTTARAPRPFLRTPMACLGGEQHVKQWWSVDGPVAADFTDDGGILVSWMQAQDFLFATVSLPAQPLEEQSLRAYRALLRVLQARQCPHLLRVWNFVPRINAFDDGTERYQLFNTGRRNAFREAGYTLNDGAPAACALGTQSGGLCVAVLAGTRCAIAIENPRQVSSYHYPKQYGTDAPIFSRAAWLRQPSGEDLLFISGTASIVGHRTLHAGDTLAQVKESVNNIEAVLHNANQRAGALLWSLAGLKGRVDIRHAADYPMVSAHLLAQGMTQFCFLEADICRDDLLVEIEAEGQAFAWARDLDRWCVVQVALFT